MVAHIAGVPIEEALLWLIPLGSVGVAGLRSLLRDGVEAGRN
jgi:hypothetical protein